VLRVNGTTTMLTHTAAAALAEDISTTDLLLVRLDQDVYALPSSSVREVARCRTITPVPGAPAALPGILNQRGTILAVVDPRLILGLAQAPLSRASRLVIIAHDDLEMALIVDGVLDLVTVPTGSIEPLSSVADAGRGRILRGVVRHDDRLVALLDLAELVAGLRDWS
jgi:purine-binding chemotaxis protein CheW